MDTIREIESKIYLVYEKMTNEMATGIVKDNKSAYRRARIASLELEKLLKEFRKISPK